eukprot:TRINITY_DN21324_c0_g1_i1.p1 TRINITY_DN21324_c0_g1~~TRINITY_DN21324_c0_g1_i1.p1  ORF type:complete len:131 (-),score=37.37 TRINITY_DN21324_c0_g1_i1:17-409(-)
MCIRDRTYTKDAYLEEHEIEGYVGFPLIGEDPKRVEGTLIAMSKTAIPEDGALHTVMKLARSRTQAELVHTQYENKLKETCLLYTSDAADDLLCVDLGGRRIIKKKKKQRQMRRININLYMKHNSIATNV